MSRAPNFFYQDPTAAAGSNLVRAIFGDPAAAAQQQQQQAVNEEHAARTRLLTGQAAGVEGQNAAAGSLPELLARMRAPEALPTPSLDSPGFLDGAGPSAMPPSADAAFRDGLPAFVAALAQMQGDKVDTGETAGTLASFFGGDELARRGLVAQGHSPTADFAITPERADAIAMRDADAKRESAFGVARINHESDIPIANIRRGSAFDVAGVQASASRYGADTRAGASRDVAAIRSTGPAPGFDAIKRVFPGATPSSGFRTPEHNRAVGGVDNSHHLGRTPGVQAYDFPVQPGMTIEQAAARVEAESGGTIRVIEMRDETGRVGPNGKRLGGWHMALQSVGPAPRSGRGPATPAAAKPPKPVTRPQLTQIDAEIKTLFDAGGVTLAPFALNEVRRQAIANFQHSGNVVGAVQDTFNEFRQRGRARREGTAAPGWGPARATPPATAILRYDAQGNRIGAARTPSGASSSRANPVRVTTLEQAHALPAGQYYQTPDGRMFKK